ncbi:MAG: GAF domain-containing protein [Bacteroidota bacterium]|jgi:GAF domain-containing protein
MDEIKISSASKKERYEELLPQIFSIIQDEVNIVANMANIVAALKQTFLSFSWVGFYLFDQAANELVLGPFQGNIACTRIAIGKGVCGTAFLRKETIIVPDVDQFPGHIFCDGNSRSEIVVPIIMNETCRGVLDVDSYDYNNFNDDDKIFLEYLILHSTPKIL